MKNWIVGKISMMVLCALCTTEVGAQPGYARANNITIAYEAFGNAADPAFLLIQGTGATMLHWPVELCERLAERGFYVIRFDNRDIGLSTKLDALGQPDWEAIGPYVGTCEKAPLPYTLLDMARDATSLMDALQVEKANVAGVSMGGAIAQLIAIHFPDRMLTLTSMAASSGNLIRATGREEALLAMSTPPPATEDRDSLATYLVLVYKALGALDDEEILYERALGHIYRSWYPEGTNRQLAAVLVGDYCDRREQLSHINIPTLVIHGDADPMVPLEAGLEVYQSIPGAALCTIKGMGHDISLRFVNSLVDCMAGFAAKTPR